MEFLGIVDENDIIVGSAPVKEIYDKGLTHRIVHIFVFNDKNEMLLQLRSSEAGFCPMHWCTAAAGHVQSGETYEQAAARELDEETHIKAKPVLMFKDFYEYRPGARKILASLRIEYSGPLTPGDKVEKLRFFTMEEVRKMIDAGEKIHPELLFLLDRHFDLECA